VTVRVRSLFWPLVWAFKLVGLADLIIVTERAAFRVDLPSVAGQLGAGYAIPILYVPALFLTHLLALRLLLRMQAVREKREAVVRSTASTTPTAVVEIGRTGAWHGTSALSFVSPHSVSCGMFGKALAHQLLVIGEQSILCTDETFHHLAADDHVLCCPLSNGIHANAPAPSSLLTSGVGH